MKNEEEIRKMLKEIEQLVKCDECGTISTRFWEGALECPNCGGFTKGDWEDLGMYKALKWVLEEESEKTTCVSDE